MQYLTIGNQLYHANFKTTKIITKKIQKLTSEALVAPELNAGDIICTSPGIPGLIDRLPYDNPLLVTIFDCKTSFGAVVDVGVSGI